MSRASLRAMVDTLGGGFVTYLLLMELSTMGASTLQLYSEAICALHHQVRWCAYEVHLAARKFLEVKHGRTHTCLVQYG